MIATTFDRISAEPLPRSFAEHNRVFAPQFSDYEQFPQPEVRPKTAKNYRLGAVAIVGTAVLFWAPVIAFMMG